MALRPWLIMPIELKNFLMRQVWDKTLFIRMETKTRQVLKPRWDQDSRPSLLTMTASGASLMATFHDMVRTQLPRLAVIWQIKIQCNWSTEYCIYNTSEYFCDIVTIGLPASVVVFPLFVKVAIKLPQLNVRQKSHKYPFDYQGK